MATSQKGGKAEEAPTFSHWKFPLLLFVFQRESGKKGGDGTEWESHVSALSVETPPLCTDD